VAWGAGTISLDAPSVDAISGWFGVDLYRVETILLLSEWRPGPDGLFLSLRESPSPLARTVDIPVVVAHSPAGRSSSRMRNRMVAERRWPTPR